MTEANRKRNALDELALAGEHAKHLAQLEGLRSAGDYDAPFSIPAAELAPELEKARRLVESARLQIEGE